MAPVTLEGVARWANTLSLATRDAARQGRVPARFWVHKGLFLEGSPRELVGPGALLGNHVTLEMGEPFVTA